MTRVVVAGLAECNRFAHVDHFAEYLAARLPDFKYHRIVISKYEWPAWVTAQNNKNKWNHTHSPLVWSEPGMSGGKAHLIGGASDFWEHVQQYYGLLSNVTHAEGELLAQDAFQKFMDSEREAETLRRTQRHRHVTVSGAGHSMASLLVRELLKVPSLQMELGMVVTLFDRQLDDIDDLREIALDMRGVGGRAGFQAARATDSVAVALTDCDLLIVLDGCVRAADEELASWLRRNSELMSDIALDVNRHAPATCRIVYAAPAMPACFNATVLADDVIDVDRRCVVAVTADLGVAALSVLAARAGVPIADLHCPPVWGCVGLNRLVDLRGTRFATEVSVPNRRSLRAGPNTTLPTGTTKKVMFPIGPRLSLADTGALWRDVAADAAAAVDEMFFAKVKATCDMLEFWFQPAVATLRGSRNRRMMRLLRVSADNARDKGASALPKGPVISLGIVTRDYAFDFPEGVNFSQPVCLRNGNWVPYLRFQPPKDRFVKLKALFTMPCYYLKKLKIGMSLKADHFLDAEEIADKKKLKFQREYGERIKKLQKANAEKMAEKLRERALNIRFRRRWRQIERESGAMIRDNVVTTTLRELIKAVLDICEPYPEIEIVFKHPNFEVSGEDQVPEEVEKEEGGEDEEDEDDEDDEDDDDDDDDD